MFCSKCGAEIKEGHKFCMSCGAPVNIAPTKPAPQTVVKQEPVRNVEPKASKSKAPKAAKESKRARMETNADVPEKKKGKAGTVILIIVAALLVVAIVLIAFKLLWHPDSSEDTNVDDDWAAVSEATQASTEVSTEDTSAILNEQLQQIISEKGDIQGKSFDMCKGKRLTDLNGVMGSVVLDVSGDGVEDLLVAYVENKNICVDVYTVEESKAVKKGDKVINVPGYEYVDGCEVFGGLYLKETSDGWNLILDEYELAWMFSDGTGRNILAVSCNDHAYNSAGDYDYAGSDMAKEDYQAGNDVAKQIGMSGVKNSLDNPYFVEDQNVTMIAACHSELLPIADTMSVKIGEKFGVFYMDKVDSTDNSAAATLVKAYEKYQKDIEKKREKAQAENSDYILPMSNQRELTAEDLEDIKDDAWLLKLARNEIYARYGRMFKDEQIQEYFDSKDWYEPTYTADEFESEHKNLLSQMEVDNATFIQQYEQKLQN